MLNDDILLDSVCAFSDGEQQKSSNGRKDSESPCVPSSCPDVSGEAWYALRVSYSRELKIKTMLDGMGIRTFVPMEWKKKEKDGKTEKVLQPAVSNLCFAYASKGAIEGFISGFGESSPVHFYWDRTASRPLVVPEKAMEDFITVASAIDQDIIYLREITPKLRAGATVTITSGPFQGVTGKVVRIRKNRRILVELPGFLAVATTYLRPEILKIL